MSEDHRPNNWPLIGGIAGAAALLGAGAVYLLRPTALPVATAPAAAPVQQAAIEVKIPASYVAASDIAVEPVASGDVSAEIVAPATVAATPQGEASVVARASGTVTRITHRLGDAVKAGEILALVDSLDAASMVADRSVAAAKADLARRNYEREAGLFTQGVTPRQDMEAAQAGLAVAQAEARRAAAVARAAHVSGSGGAIAVVSPISGRITAADAELGAFVQPQAELFRVANSGAVQIQAAITAADARRIAPGDRATVTMQSGLPVAATVRAVTPTVGGTTQSATVVLTPLAASRDLVIGEGVQARIRTKGQGPAGMSVPEEAVQTLGGRDVLFIRTAAGFRAQPVLVGLRSGGTARIIAGVRPGDKVATRNAFLVKAEATKNAGEEEE